MRNGSQAYSGDGIGQLIYVLFSVLTVVLVVGAYGVGFQAGFLLLLGGGVSVWLAYLRLQNLEKSVALSLLIPVASTVMWFYLVFAEVPDQKQESEYIERRQHQDEQARLAERVRRNEAERLSKRVDRQPF